MTNLPKSSLATQFMAEIEHFIVETGCPATRIGRSIQNPDAGLIHRLRKGRQPTLATVERIRSFMASYRLSLAASQKESKVNKPSKRA